MPNLAESGTWAAKREWTAHRAEHHQHGCTLFWKSIGLAPASLALAQEALDQGAIGGWRLTVAPTGVPMLALLVVASWMSQAEVQQIAGAAQAARLDMLNCGSEAGVRVEAQSSTTDQAFAGPEVG